MDNKRMGGLSSLAAAICRFGPKIMLGVLHRCHEGNKRTKGGPRNKDTSQSITIQGETFFTLTGYREAATHFRLTSEKRADVRRISEKLPKNVLCWLRDSKKITSNVLDGSVCCLGILYAVERMEGHP